MLLTQSTMPIIGWIATVFGYVMEVIFKVLSSMGIENIGLCIIIFTIFVRILLLPLMVSQQKFQRISQAMQPEINKIQKKYRGKKDQVSMQRQQEEIQAVYDKYGTSPTGGCGQVLVQMPVLLALYQVIRNVPAYVPTIYQKYAGIAEGIMGVDGYLKPFNAVVKSVGSNYVKVFEKGATVTVPLMIDKMNYFNATAWDKLAQSFPSVDITPTATELIKMNNFVAGINIAQTPGFKPSIYWLIPVLAGLFQFLSAKTMRTPQQDENAPGAGMTKSMTTMMPLMSVYFCLIMPVGLGLYWIMSAVLQLIQQLVLNKYFDSKDLDELVAKNREKAKKKKAKGKKSFMDRLNPNNTESGQDQEGVVRTVDPLRTIRGNAAIKTKGLADPNENAADVEYSKRGEIGKGAYSVREYDRINGTKGGNQ